MDAIGAAERDAWSNMRVMASRTSGSPGRDVRAPLARVLVAASIVQLGCAHRDGTADGATPLTLTARDLPESAQSDRSMSVFLCDERDDRGRACMRVGRALLEAGDEDEAVTYFQRACRQGHVRSCEAAARLEPDWADEAHDLASAAHAEPQPSDGTMDAPAQEDPDDGPISLATPNHDEELWGQVLSGIGIGLAAVGGALVTAGVATGTGVMTYGGAVVPAYACPFLILGVPLWADGAALRER